MKCKLLQLFIILIISSQASAQSSIEIEHCLRNGTPDRVAAVITGQINKKITFQRINYLVSLLNDKSKPGKLNSTVQNRDIALVILSRITQIETSSRQHVRVKEIISHQDKNEEVFRYHILDIKENEFEYFRQKVIAWMEQRFPA